MKYLITGLGNKGKQYENTRHNIGFKIADNLVNSLEGKFQEDQFGWIARCTYNNNKLIILKPNVYMNLSGNSIRFWLNYEKISIENSIVLTDDLYLNFGSIRIKNKGSSAGHNGLKSIEKELLTQKYPRLRFGIGNQFNRGEQIDYVLGNWNKEEINMLSERIKMCITAIKSFIFSGLSTTMDVFNRK